MKLCLILVKYWAPYRYYCYTEVLNLYQYFNENVVIPLLHFLLLRGGHADVNMVVST